MSEIEQVSDPAAYSQSAVTDALAPCLSPTENSVHEMTAAEVMIARVELLEAKYPRATRVGFVAVDRACRLINLGLYMIGVVTVLRWLIF